MSITSGPCTRLEQALVDDSAIEGILTINGEGLPFSASKIRSSVISQRMRQSAHKESSSFCIQIELSHVCLEGSLDLRNAGSSREPLPGLLIEDCSLEGSLLLDNAYVRHIRLHRCRFLPQTSSELLPEPLARLAVAARQCTFAQNVELCDVVFHGANELDFAMGEFGEDCTLSDLRGCDGGGETGIGRISFVEARVAKDLQLLGVQVKVLRGASIDAQLVQVGGTVNIGASDICGCRNAQICKIVGTLYLLGAQIGDQLLFQGAQLKCINALNTIPLPPTTPGESNFIAVLASGSVIKRDIAFAPARLEGSEVPSEVYGTFKMDGTTVGGYCALLGNFHAAGGDAAISAPHVKIGLDLFLGVNLPFKSGCSGDAAFDFRHSKIGGDLRALDSTLTLDGVPSRQEGASGKRRYDEAALDLRNASINGSLILEASGAAASNIRGLDLIACKIGGRLSLKGVTISAAVHFGKAIRAHGARIEGGINLKPLLGHDGAIVAETRILGDFRMRNAVVKSAFVIRAAYLESREKEGVAFWGSNTSFDDVFIENYRDSPSNVQGEVRLRGSEIAGVLRIRGSNLRSGSSGSALDCFTAHINRGVELVSHDEDLQNSQAADSFLPTTIFGIVRMDGVHTSGLKIGPRHDIATNASLIAVHLQGVLLLRGFQATGNTSWIDVRFESCTAACTTSAVPLLKQLDRLTVPVHSSIIIARSAKLGRQLTVRLHPASHGFIDLFRAETGLLCGPGGEERDSWGTPPKLDASGVQASVHEKVINGVVLNLDGFMYDRISDGRDYPPAAWKLWQWFQLADIPRYILGRPTTKRFGQRIAWLERQCYFMQQKNLPYRATLMAHPLRQLARVYREQGYLRSANRLTVERRWRQIFSSDRHNDRFFAKLRAVWNPETFFGLFFGFGYSPLRALITLLLLAFADFEFAKRPCHFSQPLIEAARFTLPYVRLRSYGGPSCQVLDGYHSGYMALRIFLDGLSWIVFPLAALTFSGLLREERDGSK